MGMFGNVLGKKPMFGQIPGMGMMQPQMQQPAQQPMMPPGAMQPEAGDMTQRPKFFGQGGVGRNIAGYIGDALQRLGGGQATFAPHMMRMQEQDAEIRARIEAEQRQRKQGREDKQWEWANKPKDNDQLTQYMVNAGIDPKSERGRALYERAAMNKVDPITGVPFTDAEGNSGLQYVRAGSLGGTQGGVQEGATATNPQTGEKVVYRNGAWELMGGGVGNGTNGFQPR